MSQRLNCTVPSMPHIVLAMHRGFQLCGHQVVVGRLVLDRSGICITGDRVIN